MVASEEEEGEGRCEDACSSDQLLNGEGECVSYDAIKCRHRGERAYATLDGSFECDCAEGWGRVMGEGDCKQEGTKCGENRLVYPFATLSFPVCTLMISDSN